MSHADPIGTCGRRGCSCPHAIASIVFREAKMRVSRQSPFHVNSRIRGASLAFAEGATSTLKVKGSREKNAYFSIPKWRVSLFDAAGAAEPLALTEGSLILPCAIKTAIV